MVLGHRDEDALVEQRLPDDARTTDRKGAEGDIDEGLEAEKQGFARAFNSDDAKEGVSAFLGKRQARFEGK